MCESQLTLVCATVMEILDALKKEYLPTVRVVNGATYRIIELLPKSGRPTKFSANTLLQLIENGRDNETAAKELVAPLKSNRLSMSTTALKVGVSWDGHGVGQPTAN